MKARLLILSCFALACLLFVPSTASAQDEAGQPHWRVGITGGANHNWYDIDVQYQADYHYASAWGWSAGVFGQYNFMDWLALRAELEATERNYRFYRTLWYSGTNYIAHNTYVQVPVMAQFGFGGQKVRGFVNIGVYAGYWAAGRTKGTMFETLNEETIPIDEPYIFQQDKDQRWDFGLAGGLGLEYRCAEHWAIHAEGRCYYSYISSVKPYMLVKDNRYNTTIGMNVGVAYVF